ncbi:MAG: FMN-binding glutamate synthase family protein [Candidatus Bathyarchaeota archaeon]|nr:MAG: FMN-binding glutamate synthase family protein [Candidatus Bathyarchaeota archaeon]
MSLSKPNASPATLTKNRTDPCPISGICVTCIDGCPGPCEVAKSAIRGSEIIYPAPFGVITVGSQKTYPVDLSHFNIMGTTVGAVGIETDSDKAIFPNVDLETRIGEGKGLRLKVPWFTCALGSTRIAKDNWKELAIGAAISGTMQVIGENVCGMDVNAKISNGKVVHSPELESRVKTYNEWRKEGYGAIVVQSNIEDTRLGVLEYAISDLEVDAVELKWGQGAKDIGGEVKIKDLTKAQLLKRRGYIVLPDPENPDVIEAFKKRHFGEFERHSRVGMVTREDFVKRVKELRSLGAEYVFLKTGAYRPADVARAVKFSSVAGIDLLTVDGAGGGTGMSPWRMMNEWGVPGVEIWSLTYQYTDRLAKKGEHVPSIAFAGGITMEDHIFKALALGAPYVKAIGMARAPLTAVMVAKNVGQRIMEDNLPVYYARYGNTVEAIFVEAGELKNRHGKRFKDIPTGAIGLYTYNQRLVQGLKQLMCGARKFTLQHVTRDDIVTLTSQAAKASGIKYVMDADKEEVEKILS